MMSGSYEQHHAAAGVHQPTSNPSPEHQMHSGQQMAAAHRPVYTAAVPSVVPQGQPLSASVATYSQPAVSRQASSPTTLYYFVLSIICS